ETQRRLARGLEQVAARISESPDVESVALTTGGPMLGYLMVTLYFPDGRPVPLLAKREPAWIAATPNYLTTAGLRLVSGRFFNAADRGAQVVVVNETAAAAYWPGQSPIGKCIVMGVSTDPCTTVIG